MLYLLNVDHIKSNSSSTALNSIFAKPLSWPFLPVTYTKHTIYTHVFVLSIGKDVCQIYRPYRPWIILLHKRNLWNQYGRYVTILFQSCWRWLDWQWLLILKTYYTLLPFIWVEYDDIDITNIDFLEYDEVLLTSSNPDPEWWYIVWTLTHEMEVNILLRLSVRKRAVAWEVW